MTMDAAWESFQKAVSFEEKSIAADKHLNEAVRLETEALAV